VLRKGNGRLLKLLLAVAAVVVVGFIVVPRPIEGYWVGISFYLDGEHQFFRFSDGHVYYYNPLVAPHYDGTYRRIGWNTYIWGEDAIARFPDKKVVPNIVRVGWFRSYLPNAQDDPKHWPKMYRDWRIFDVARVMKLSQEKGLTNLFSEMPSASVVTTGPK
jgi:hypothetical protein